MNNQEFKRPIPKEQSDMNQFSTVSSMVSNDLDYGFRSISSAQNYFKCNNDPNLNHNNNL